MNDDQVLDDTHKLQPIGLHTLTTFLSCDLLEELGKNKDSIWGGGSTGGMYDSRGEVRLRNLLVEVNDARIVRNNNMNKACVQVISDLSGLDGTLFGLPGSAEVRQDLVKRGRSPHEAEQIIAEAYRSHLRLVGVAMTEKTPQPGDDTSNLTVTAQYQGVFNFFSMFQVEPGDMLQHFIPTPSQLAEINFDRFATLKMWGTGQVPVLLRPVRMRSVSDEIARALDLYVNDPDIHDKLYGTRYLQNSARNNSLLAINLYQKMIAGLGIYRFMKATNTALAPVKPHDGTQKLNVSMPYQAFDLALDNDGAGLFKLNTDGNCLYPELRRLLYRNLATNQVPHEGDAWVNALGSANIQMVTDPDSFLSIWGVINGLIDPGEVIPNSFEGLVGLELANNQLDYSNMQVGMGEVMSMKKTDSRMKPLAAVVQWQTDLLRVLNIPMVRPGQRSAYEVGDVVDSQGNFRHNIAKTVGSHGMIEDVNLEIGRMLRCQELRLRNGIDAFTQLVMLQVNTASARAIRRNSPGRLGAAEMFGSNNI